MFAPTRRGRAAGLALGYVADLMLGDPRRGHPVAMFGSGAAALERLTYSDRRAAGAAHTGVLHRRSGGGGHRRRPRRGAAGPGWTAALTAAATFVALGGTSLARTGADMARMVDGDDVDGARDLLPSLCGRDPAALDVAGLTRAALESVAENTSDAAVAPLCWGALGGVPGLLVYRGANTLDAMIGHRSPRYNRFGWAAARLDDVLNYLPARATGLLVAICAPVAGGSPRRALTAWRRDAGQAPQPQRRGGGGGLRRRAGGPVGWADAVCAPLGDPADAWRRSDSRARPTCTPRCGCRGRCSCSRRCARWCQRRLP